MSLLLWCLLPFFVLQGGHYLKAIAKSCSIPLSLSISSLCNTKGFPLAQLGSKDKLLGQNSNCQPGVGCGLLMSSAWSLGGDCGMEGRYPWIIPFDKDFLCVLPGRLQMAYVGRKELEGRSDLI